MTLAALFLLFTMLVLVVVAATTTADRQRQEGLQHAMDGVLTRRGEVTLDELTERLDLDKYILGRWHGQAQALYAEGRHLDAVTHMALGCAAIEALAPNFLTAVRALRGLARQVSVIVSVEPVRTSAFRTLELRGLAGVGQALHHLLLTGRQQIRLRLTVIVTAYRLALRWLRDATSYAGQRRAASAATWTRIDALVADLGSAGDEAVVAARQIVQALDAVELGIVTRHRAGL